MNLSYKFKFALKEQSGRIPSMRMPKTKVIATVGPSSNSKEMLKKMIESGADVLRLNFSHGTHKEHKEVIEKIKEVRKELGRSVAIMLDTKGFEIRCVAKTELKIEPKKQIWIGDEEQLSIRPPSVLSSLRVGMELLFDDGYLIGKILEVKGKKALVEFQNGHILKNNKNVHIPKINIQELGITDIDREDIIFGCKEGVDLIAASFICSKEHVIAIKTLLHDEGFFAVQLIAKIETTKAVENFDAILQVADGIMVARGDLGIELNLETLPSLQKQLVKKASERGKFSIVATQMLESMIEHPRPTRAEVSDVANAIFDAASAVMLSGETAVGHYPIESIAQMHKIVLETEKSFNYSGYYYEIAKNYCHDINLAIAKGAVQLSISSKTKGILVFSTSGYSAMVMSHLRPQNPILCLTNQEKTYHRLAIQWGVIPILAEFITLEQGLAIITQFAIEKGILQAGDLVVTTFGAPFKQVGTTNTIQLENIGEVLFRGEAVDHRNVTGVLSYNPLRETHPSYAQKDKIVVIDQCDLGTKGYIRYAKGVVLQNHPDDIETEERFLQIVKELGIPALYRAVGDLEGLKEGQYVTLSGEQGVLIAARRNY